MGVNITGLSVQLPPDPPQGPPPGLALGQLTLEQYLALMTGGGTNTTETTTVLTMPTTTQLLSVNATINSTEITNINETSTVLAVPTTQAGAVTNSTEITNTTTTVLVTETSTAQARSTPQLTQLRAATNSTEITNITASIVQSSSATNAGAATNVTEITTLKQAGSTEITNLTETSTAQARSTPQLTQLRAATNSTEITNITASIVQSSSATNAGAATNVTEITTSTVTRTNIGSTTAGIQTAVTAISFEMAVNVSVQVTVLGYTTNTFQPLIFKASLAALLQVDLASVLVMSVISFTSARRAVDAVQVASVVATSDSTDASRVLAVLSSPDAATNLTLQLQTRGMQVATVTDMKASLLEKEQPTLNPQSVGSEPVSIGVIVGLGSFGGALFLLFIVVMCRLKLCSQAEKNAGVLQQLEREDSSTQQNIQVTQGEIVWLNHTRPERDSILLSEVPVVGPVPLMPIPVPLTVISGYPRGPRLRMPSPVPLTVVPEPLLQTPEPGYNHSFLHQNIEPTTQSRFSRGTSPKVFPTVHYFSE